MEFDSKGVWYHRDWCKQVMTSHVIGVRLLGAVDHVQWIHYTAAQGSCQEGPLLQAAQALTAPRLTAV